MIEVKNNRIYFYNTYKRDIIPADFPCMSAYVCPHCKMVLAAYYAGTIVDLEPFMEDPALKYHYTLGASNGGQYMLIDSNHHGKGCGSREIISQSARGITYQLDVWARRNEVGPSNLQSLSMMIAANTVPGFDVIPDACGADDPIVLYNEHAFTNMNNPEFDKICKRRDNLSYYVDSVAGNNRIVKLHEKSYVPIHPIGL